MHNHGEIFSKEHPQIRRVKKMRDWKKKIKSEKIRRSNRRH
jgi:hypothetical protein